MASGNIFKFLVEIRDSKKPVIVKGPFTDAKLCSVIKERFGLSKDEVLLIQFYDEDWGAYIDLEDCTSLQDKAKLKVKVKENECVPSNISITSVTEPLLASSPNVCLSTPPCNRSTNILIPKKRNWPEPFKFPVDSLPEQVIRALEKKIDLNKPANRYVRGLLLQTICNEAVSLKTHPERHEKVSLAKSIINEWGYLTEKYGKGWEGWLTSIVDGLKQARKRTGQAKPKRKRMVNEEDSVDSTSVKTDALVRSKRSKPAHLNWEPKNLEGEDNSSNNFLIQIMRIEMEKSESSRDIVKLKAMLTQSFPFRREMLNTTNSIDAVRETYPALFTEEGLLNEYELLTGAKNSLITCTRKMLKELSAIPQQARSIRGKKQLKIDKILQSMNDAIDEDERISAGDSNHERYWKAVAGLLVLPILLGEEENILIREYPATATLDNMTEDGPASPYIASQGNSLTLTTNYFIILENKCIIRTKKLTDALILTFMLYYIFWLEYPQRVCCTLKFIQIIVFQRNGTEEGNMPSKLLRLINTFNN